mmetsp:Transcript_8739/g.12366  ORF Transcript_8739/g.12366 Transcript_8739/m.12366 type:complete len:369 (-) Transcript_8739:131-1237(-)
MTRPAVPKTKFQRYFYAKQNNFEQSLDIWEPDDLPYEGEKGRNDLPTVVLVVGSGWMGHRSVIYSGTSWWNSSGPRTIARLGCVCVCVRHRGGFPQVSAQIAISLLLLVTSVLSMFVSLDTTFMVVTIICLLWGLLVLAGRGSASFDNMLEDVADALVWVDRNRNTVGRLRSPLVFGGYSSGGHVAASLLQRPDLLASRGLPHPENICDGVLMISGVLAVRPPITAHELPRWLTDITVNAVFGKNRAFNIPSPLHGPLPRIPHLLVGCRNEVFGLNWLDLFFCSGAYCKALQFKGVRAKFVQISSDHWNILNSTDLARALEIELPWLCSKHQTRKASDVYSTRFDTNHLKGGHALAVFEENIQNLRKE